MLHSEQMDTQTRWIEIMTHEGGYWKHDGNLKRPYALHTSGKISNFYVNCSAITKRPEILSEAAMDLFKRLDRDCMPDAYVGLAYGAITLAYELARHDDNYRGGDVEAWFTIKGDDGEMKLDRFEFTPRIESVIMVKDIITTFKTTSSSIKALQQKAAATGSKILPYVLALVNRSGQSEIDGFKIISLIEVNNALTWDPGENPFLGKEQERVQPIRPEQNWDALTANYPR